jgi:hypothetical protein
MWPATRDAFYGLTVPLEDDIPHMYRDRLGYVTWGIGIKDDPGPTKKTINQPWVKGNGYLASGVEVEAEWKRIKAGPLYASNAAKIATMHLPKADRDEAFWDIADGMEGAILRQFPGWATWPADAQLAALSMAWNFGPNLTGEWPTLSAHLTDQDWEYAALNCEPAAGPNARSRQNKVLFFQAARAAYAGDEPKVLFGPGVAVSTGRFVQGANNPPVTNWHAWWVQAMLRDDGKYLLKLDGQFGPRSQQAWNAAMASLDRPFAYSLSSLTALSALTLRITVTT